MKTIRKKAAAALLGAVLACTALTGCDRVPWTIFDLLDMFGGTGSNVAEPGRDSDTPLEEGQNVFLLDPYPLAGNGLTPLLDAVAARLDHTPAPIVNVGQFVLRLDPDGRVIGADLTLCGYLGSPAVYQGGCAIVWDAAAHSLQYTALGTLYQNDPIGGENGNLTPETVNANLAALPLDALADVLPGGMELSFTPFDRPEAAAPVVDMRNAPKELDADRYAAGGYGTADGGPQWTLQAGAVNGDGGQTWQFCFAPADPGQWVGSPDRYTCQDIRLTDTGLQYTRDWGETWQALPDEYASLAGQCVEAYTGITRSSWSVWPEEGGPAAFLLGEGATLVWTMDGENWSSRDFFTDGRAVDRRTAGMLPNGRGFVSFGGEWTMGSGGYCELWLTADGGQNWARPATMPSERSICGAAMLPDGTLMVSTETSAQDNWPDVFYTADGGASWRQLNLPWTDAEMQQLYWLYRLDSLTQDGTGVFHALFTQEPMGNLAAEFTAESLDGYWQFAGLRHVQH